MLVMRSHLLLWCLLVGACVVAWGPLKAAAAPAEIVILLDTSRSMQEPVPGQPTLRKIDLAKKVAAQVATTAEKAGHRVGLYRFRQSDVLVRRGIGQDVVTTEDQQQCSLMGDMLVGVAAGNGASIRRWVDGKRGVGEPEITALGHSPLLGAVRLVLRYIRGRRMFAPRQNCVNAWVVVLTDGIDTCVSGGGRHRALKELREVSHKEDIRTLVLSFRDASKDAKAIAALGQEHPSKARVYGVKDVSALTRAVSQIEGRIAPEACLLSGVAPKRVGLAKPAPPPAATAPAPRRGCQGCQASRAAPMSLAWGVLAWLVLLIGFRRSQRRRRRARRPRRALWTRLRRWGLWGVLLVGVFIGGCQRGQGPVPKAPAPRQEAPPPRLEDPHARASRILKAQRKLLKVGEALRKKTLRPQLAPSQIFARLTLASKSPAAIVKACRDLVHSMGYEPYPLFQRGVDGCLASRRCNAWDRALVMRACLQHHKVKATILQCARHKLTPAMRQTLLTMASTHSEPKKRPAIKPFVDAMDKAFHAIIRPTKSLEKRVDRVAGKISRASGRGLLKVTREVVDKLKPMAKLDPARTLKWVRQQSQRFVYDHVVVKTSTGLVDPVFAKAPACKTPLADEPGRAVTIRAALHAQYVVNGVWQHKRIPLGQIEWMPHREGLAPLALAIADASTQDMPKGLPAVARSGCLRGFFRLGKRLVKTRAFPIRTAGSGAKDKGCGADAIAVTPGMSLATLSLHTSIRMGRRWGHANERTLINRFGYVKQLRTGLRSGPMYSARSARKLIPMRVELLVGGGMPTFATLVDRMMASMWQRRQSLLAGLSQQLGGKVVAQGTSQPKPLAWQTLLLLAQAAGYVLPRGHSLLQPRPWRLATIVRRGFEVRKNGVAIVPQTIFDIIDWPFWVVPPLGSDDAATAESRLRANMALGVLATEAERLAGMIDSKTGRIINASAMFRDKRTGQWAPFPIARGRGWEQLPYSVIAAARLRRRQREKVIMTPGAVPFLGGRYIAWWRVQVNSGLALGEIRFDGTFYGGIAEAKVIATFNECLATQAILALRGVRLHPDVRCCMRMAAKMWLNAKGAVGFAAWIDILDGDFKPGQIKNHAMATFGKQFAKISMARLKRIMPARVKAAWTLFAVAKLSKKLADRLDKLKDLHNMLYGDGSEAPPCVHIVKDPRPNQRRVVPIRVPPGVLPHPSDPRK